MADLNDLHAFRRGAEWAIAAGTAVELGMIAALEGGPLSTSEIARRLNVSPRGVHTLLGALEELGAVSGEESGWRLTGAGRARFLDREAPDYEADSLLHWLRTIRRWSAELPETVRTGDPATEDSPARGAKQGKDLERFMAAMANRSPGNVAAVADAVRGAAPGAKTLLDVGGGPGVYSTALADRGFEVSLLDRPEVIEFVAEIYGLGADERIHLVPADFLHALPEESYDVILLANVTHIYGPETNRELLRQAAGRLNPGGCVAIVDFVRGVSAFAPLFALTMLLSTDDGGTWSLPEYTGWLRDAGLERVRCATIGPDSQMITAVNPSKEKAPG
jgi:2-polyprenyl-3-methyl-5-hydroxy-6-metoxy-1,4-benzoquinol methylase